MTGNCSRLALEAEAFAAALLDSEMPYLRVTCPELSPKRRQAVATRLTEEVSSLFYNPKAPTSKADMIKHTTVHFVPYEDTELFVGGHPPAEAGVADLTVELSDWHMNLYQRRKVARVLTPVLAELFGLQEHQLEGINIRFHSYPPSAFAVGGKLLSERVPFIAQVMKRLGRF